MGNQNNRKLGKLAELKEETETHNHRDFKTLFQQLRKKNRKKSEYKIFKYVEYV